MSQAAHRLVNSLDASGFGLPFQMSQFTSRVEAVGLFGAELLASHKQGLKAVVKRFNDAQYLCMKRALGASTKMSIGCHVKVLLECRQSCRLGSRFLERVILLKSRIQCLPADHPVVIAVNIAETFNIETWWTQTDGAMTLLGLSKDICECGYVSESSKLGPGLRRKAVCKFKHEVVRPLMVSMEHCWFVEAIEKLGEDTAIQYCWSRPVVPWGQALCWSGWGRVMWKFHKALCTARITQKLPMAWFGGADLVMAQPRCPLCNALDADLFHVLCACGGTFHLRQELANYLPCDLYHWVFYENIHAEGLYEKVKYFGQCMATFSSRC
jgi:hypothetical protein